MEVDYKYPSWYAVKKRDALKVIDYGDYKLHSGELNPQILMVFLSEYFDNRDTVWEPFAGLFFHEMMDKFPKLKFIAYDLYAGIDPQKRIQTKNSVEEGPNKKINGMIFHPPYFGSAPFCEDSEDLAREESPQRYLEKLDKTISHCVGSMKDGHACVVGRNYRYGGKNIPLDWWFVKLFLAAGFEIEEMYSSIPDIAVIMRLK